MCLASSLSRGCCVWNTANLVRIRPKTTNDAYDKLQNYLSVGMSLQLLESASTYKHRPLLDPSWFEIIRRSSLFLCKKSATRESRCFRLKSETEAPVRD
jgi:hypothetical protein